jgi:crotonobetainyl-CoA hydratase
MIADPVKSSLDDSDDRSVLVDRRGAVMIITINRPDVRNAVNLAVSIAVGDALDEAEGDRGVWAIVLTGAGDKAFCAGADLKALARGERTISEDPKRAAWGFAGYVNHQVSKPTIAAVNGMALGGGTELVLASDLAIAADEAIFGLPEVKRGIFAGAGGLFRLPAQVPPKVAMSMILTGEPITAAMALELHLVNAVVSQGDVLGAAVDLAERICANAPLAVQHSKRVAKGITDERIESETASWDLSARELKNLMLSRDAQEGPKAFAEGRSPVWTAE